MDGDASAAAKPARPRGAFPTAVRPDELAILDAEIEAAQELGIEIPHAMLLRADRLIE